MSKGEIARRWWAALAKPEGRRGPDRAALAELRRCRSANQALMLAAGLDLMRRLRATEGGASPEKAALLAIILAHIRDDDPNVRVARAIGRESFNDESSAQMSEARFRRLLLSRTPDDLLAQMTRLVRLLKGTVNVADLAETVLFWGERRRRSWAFDYYNAMSASPETTRAPAGTIQELSSDR